MPEARADTPILRNCIEYVPTFAKGSVANTWAGITATSDAATMPFKN
jgi:glycine/D-amino acid oxidase-like deaminating enzyme